MTCPNRGFAAAALAALLILLPLTGGCGDNKARAEIEAAYADIDAATSQRNATQMISHYAPDFQGQVRKGQNVNRQQLQALLAQILSLATSAKAKTTIESVTVTGNEATAKGSARVEMTLTNPMTRQSATMTNENTFQDTWVKNGDKWQIKRSNALSSKSMVNGKPVPGG